MGLFRFRENAAAHTREGILLLDHERKAANVLVTISQWALVSEEGRVWSSGDPLTAIRLADTHHVYGVPKRGETPLLPEKRVESVRFASVALPRGCLLLYNSQHARCWMSEDENALDEVGSG